MSSRETTFIPCAEEEGEENLVLQEALEQERALSSKLMRIIIQERKMVAHLQEMLSRKRQGIPLCLPPEATEDTGERVCPDCRMGNRTQLAQ